ncbi:MAG: class I SAM-dependent methyltransferase, partial [Anaerolineae bacterium]|nr:class I SAM-dependent methyltransferase [Anaerolineae bacterium]
MDEDTLHRLNAINREFYKTTASEFDQTRGKAWLGWDKLRDYLAAPLSVLDVGCGNGRFGIFLAEAFNELVTYHGIDNNSALLESAKTALAAMPHISATLTEQDIITQPPDSGTYDLVVLFGVIHHVPGAENRLALMRQLAGRVTQNGLLCFASWRFYEYERFRERIVDWGEDIEVEQGDYLLDWRRGERALRYCHYVDDAEQAALIAATGLSEVLTYRADGEDNRMNAYSVL